MREHFRKEKLPHREEIMEGLLRNPQLWGMFQELDEMREAVEVEGEKDPLKVGALLMKLTNTVEQIEADSSLRPVDEQEKEEILERVTEFKGEFSKISPAMLPILERLEKALLQLQ